MVSLFDQVVNLVVAGDILISVHGYDELANDGVFIKDVIRVDDAVVVAEYPNHGKGPCVLVLQMDRAGLPIHIVWGIPTGKESPAVLVTAYRPDPNVWEKDFITRKEK